MKSNNEPKLIVRINLPFPAKIVKGELQVEVPVGNAPLFTESAIRGTEAQIGKRDAAVLLDDLSDEYFYKLVTGQMRPKGILPELPETPEDLQRAFDACDEKATSPKGWDKV